MIAGSLKFLVEPGKDGGIEWKQAEIHRIRKTDRTSLGLILSGYEISSLAHLFHNIENNKKK